MSDTIAEKKIAALPALNKDNFPIWIWALQSALRSGRVWDEIFALDPKTQLPLECPEADDKPTEYELYMEKALKACEWIDDAVGYEHLALVEKFRKKTDAVGMLDAIKEKYAKKTPANRHQSLVKLLNVAKKPDESCSEFTARIAQLQSYLRLIRPLDYTLADLDDEICTQGLLANLDHSSEYYSMALSLNPLDFDTISSSMNEQDENHAGSVPFATKTPISSANAASDNADVASKSDLCKLCEKQGHFVVNCPRLLDARDWLRTIDPTHKNSPGNNYYQGNGGWNGRGWKGRNNNNCRGGGRGNGRGGGRGGNPRGRNGRGGGNNSRATRANAVEFVDSFSISHFSCSNSYA